MKNNAACKMVGCEFPLFAFSHCRDVVAAVSRAGGFGVFGASSHTPEELEIDLKWIDEHVGGKPYGVDILIPENLGVVFDKPPTAEELGALIPTGHIEFTARLLSEYGINVKDNNELVEKSLPAVIGPVGEALMDVAFQHPIRLIANALGIAPQSMITRARKHGVPVAALVGAKEHAIRQVNAGVDLIVAQGTEAAGHCGEVTTLVLVPEVISAISAIGKEVPVLAAGGISTGGQMAGCIAMGAAGAWTGTVWLATMESETSDAIRQKIISASSRDTIRSRTRTGKPSRQLRSAWHNAWDGEGGPGPLAMPIMGMLAQPAFRKIDSAVESGNEKARELVSYWVGQGVGMIDAVRSADQVVQDFKLEFADAYMGLHDMVGE